MRDPSAQPDRATGKPPLRPATPWAPTGVVPHALGLRPFGEEERDIFFGRDADVDAVYRLVTADSYRAGLVYGELGVGKTSLLRAGLVPHLRDGGVAPLWCRDVTEPIASFAADLAAAADASSAASKRPLDVVADAVTQSSAPPYLLIIDDVDHALSGGPELVGQLGDLFARVSSRSGGRSRFLFCCAASRIHLFGRLENRTGSLFPPANRYELGRLGRDEGKRVLQQALAELGALAGAPWVETILDDLAAESGPGLLPADLQLAALAAAELRISRPSQLDRLGGVRQLPRRWLRAAAAATGSKLIALRVIAELACGETPRSSDLLADQSGVDRGTVEAHLEGLRRKGIVVAVGAAGENSRYAIAHDALVPVVRDVAGPARASARRARQRLKARANAGQRLSLPEWVAARRGRISPQTASERAVLASSTRFYKLVALAAASGPILFLLAIWVALSGRYYLDVEPASDGRGGRAVVRAGRPGLAEFFWLPGSPAYGSLIADTGFTQSMIEEPRWRAMAARQLGGSLSAGSYAEHALDLLRPQLRHLVTYGATGSVQALASLRNSAESNDEVAAFFAALTPIGRGQPDEVAIVAAGLDHGSPAVRAAALAVAVEASRRGIAQYHAVLADQLAHDDSERRRRAFTAVQNLGEETASVLYQKALAASPKPGARGELLAQLALADAASPSAATAASVLGNSDVDPSIRRQARVLLRHAFASDAAAATEAAAALAADPRAPVAERVLALELIGQLAPVPPPARAIDDVRRAHKSGDAVRAAALPIYASMDPAAAAADLALLMDQPDLDQGLRVAVALAWGEVALALGQKRNKTAAERSLGQAAQGALEQMLAGEREEVRAAAARGYGNCGRLSQSTLSQLVQSDSLPVAVGAAYGLARSAVVSGRSAAAVSGIAALWRKNGRWRHEATAVFATLARRRPDRDVVGYLHRSMRNGSPAVHEVALAGLCSALGRGYERARTALLAALSGATLPIRRAVAQCAVDNPDDATTAIGVASKLATDADPFVRADVARALANVTRPQPRTRSKESSQSRRLVAQIGGLLLGLAGDSDRGVRIIAARALAQMGQAAPKGTAAALRAAFPSADEGEKLALLAAASRVGAGDLVQLAIADPQPRVRIAAVDSAIAAKAAVAATVNAALSDTDPEVRRKTLTSLAGQRHALPPAAIARALDLAIRDPDPAISAVALTALARLRPVDQVVALLERMLAESRSERGRAQAAAACAGLAAREPGRVIALLEPFLGDPSHDVRAEMLGPLATAYAATRSAQELAAMLRDAELRPMRRLVIAAALVELAGSRSTAESARRAMNAVVESGPPLASAAARLAMGLHASSADGVEFLRHLVP